MNYTPFSNYKIITINNASGTIYTNTKRFAVFAATTFSGLSGGYNISLNLGNTVNGQLIHATYTVGSESSPDVSTYEGYGMKVTGAGGGSITNAGGGLWSGELHIFEID